MLNNNDFIIVSNNNYKNNNDYDNNIKEYEKKNKKKLRKNNAVKLPPNLTQDMMKTYVVYYKEIYNKTTGATREYFKVEKHPKLSKPWISSKSNKISIFEKLKQANNKIDELSKLDN
jgi:hypothetical protein